MSFSPAPREDEIAVFFLAQGEQASADVAQRLATFIRGARRSLDLATYDFRLSDPLRAIIAAALHERAQAGVQIRIAYDADKPELPQIQGTDPAPAGTGTFVQSLGYPYRRIGGLKLMHHKYIIRDGGTPDAHIWTGSTNLTDNSWTLQENNIVQIASPALATAYERDFTDLWNSGQIGTSGSFDPPEVHLTYGGQSARASVLFAPGRGSAIDDDIALAVTQARHRVRICSMLLNSSALLNALTNVLDHGRVPVDGVYDFTQMESVLDQWQSIPHNHWKIDAIRDIAARAHLAGKRSTPYRPDSIHDFMHNKILVVDDLVITGSYNFSHSAEQNAENILLIESPALANHYSQYIDHLRQKYHQH